MQFLKILLLPFSLLYHWVTKFRNHLYDIDYKKSFQFDTMVLSVGNLSVGGTGKSPMVEYLIRLLADENKITTLSRGYGRKTRGFRLANEDDNAATLGDEPFQFYTKYKQKINVAVGEERALAIPQILFEIPDNQMIILDDAYQHRTVIPNLSILLTDFSTPFFNDNLLPSGRLREAKSGANRADIIVVTKCPHDLSKEAQQELSEKIMTYAKKGTPIFFSGIKYLPPKNIRESDASVFSKNVLLVSGIANAAPLEEYVKSNFNLCAHLDFADHHNYGVKDLQQIKNKFAVIDCEEKVVLTTEKDAMRLSDEAFKSELAGLPIFYLPIQTYFLKNGDIFDANVLQVVNNKAKTVN